MRRPLRAAPALALLALAMCRDAPTVQPGAAEPFASRADAMAGARIFRIDFGELNHSGVKAQATLALRDGELTVTLDAVGRTPERVHPQHIHGFASGTSSCPTAVDDTNGDGTISFAEGAPRFGPVQVDLQPYPTPANAAGATHYRMTFVASQVPFDASALVQKTMVLHGDFLGASYVPSLPVACGRVEEVN